MKGYGHSACVTPTLTSEEHRLALKKVSLEGLAWLLEKDFNGNADCV